VTFWDLESPNQCSLFLYLSGGLVFGGVEMPK
jgi:hypothetical protein